MTSDPVRSSLELVGSAGLPMTVVDGVTVMTGGYPTRAQLVAYSGLGFSVAAPAGPTQLGVDGRGLGLLRRRGMLLR